MRYAQAWSRVAVSFSGPRPLVKRGPPVPVAARRGSSRCSWALRGFTTARRQRSVRESAAVTGGVVHAAARARRGRASRSARRMAVLRGFGLRGPQYRAGSVLCGGRCRVGEGLGVVAGGGFEDFEDVGFDGA